MILQIDIRLLYYFSCPFLDNVYNKLPDGGFSKHYVLNRLPELHTFVIINFQSLLFYTCAQFMSNLTKQHEVSPPIFLSSPGVHSLALHLQDAPEGALGGLLTLHSRYLPGIHSPRR